MKVTISIPFPQIRPISFPKPSFGNLFKKILDLPNILFDSLPISYTPTKLRTRPLNFSFPSLKKSRRFFGFVIGIIIVLALIVLGLFLARQGVVGSATSSKANIDQVVSVEARDQNGNSLKKSVNLHLTNAEKTNTVLIQGKRANVRNGKLFLLVNFEVDNTDKNVFYLNPTDLVRYVRGDGKKFAPTVYQGILEIRPDSTKQSNIGFVVEPNEKSFNIEVGDVNGQKQTMEIKF